MMPIRIDVSADFKRLSDDLRGLARDQLPYATALALNGLARRSVAAERQAMQEKLDRPTPFTLRGVAFLRARKDFAAATVFIMDQQARYLAPEIEGGTQVLSKSRAILLPLGIKLDSYGNIPRGALQRLKGRSDIFIGSVTFKKTGQTISGVWQRPKVGARRNAGRGTRGKLGVLTGVKTGLKLLVRFRDPVAVNKRFAWGEATRRVVNSPAVAQEFDAAMTRALATAKPS